MVNVVYGNLQHQMSLRSLVSHAFYCTGSLYTPNGLKEIDKKKGTQSETHPIKAKYLIR